MSDGSNPVAVGSHSVSTDETRKRRANEFSASTRAPTLLGLGCSNACRRRRLACRLSRRTFGLIFLGRDLNPLRCGGRTVNSPSAFRLREGDYCLLLSIFGRRSNLYLLDGADHLLQALRPLSETRAELSLGERYVDPSQPVPQRGKDRFQSKNGIDLLIAIEANYAGEIGDRSADEERRRLLNAIKKERKSASRRLERIEAELAESDQAATLQRDGELLKANLGRVEQGANSVTVSDFETGDPVEIPLEPEAVP